LVSGVSGSFKDGEHRMKVRKNQLSSEDFSSHDDAGGIPNRKSSHILRLEADSKILQAIARSGGLTVDRQTIAYR